MYSARFIYGDDNTEKHKQAEQDYISGMKYKDISTKYDVTINTVKSWKQRCGWSKSKSCTLKKSVHTNHQGCAHKKRDICCI